MTHSVVWAMGCSVAVRRTPGRGNVLLSQDIPEIAYELLPGTPAPCLGKLGRDVTSLIRLRGDVTPPMRLVHYRQLPGCGELVTLPRPTVPNLSIHGFCAPGATAVTAGVGYGVVNQIQQWVFRCLRMW